LVVCLMVRVLFMVPVLLCKTLFCQSHSKQRRIT
jgi:hypothetical protein